MKEALFWSQEAKAVRCELCPHHCLLSEGKSGICGARKSLEGKLFSLNYGAIAGMAVDPIEKKPLFHFYPGSRIFSIGTVGCNLHCPFCQNNGLSRFFDEFGGQSEKLEHLSPEELIDLVERTKSEPIIAYTYSEPVVWFEYVLETMQLARKKNIKNVLVTNGYIEEKPLEAWIPFVDAVNVDLKAFTEAGYKKLGGTLEPVKRTIQRLFEAKVHVEVTTLVVPGINDDLTEMEQLAAWLASLSPELPLHLSRYFPHHRYHAPSTSLDLLHRVKEIAKRFLFHVYLGNVVEDASTFCSQCGKLLIRREIYSVEVVGLQHGRCISCGKPLWGHYAD
ncbi:AmmeMemoRadiSam system radical SAM enzyme [Thermospira aquatica]|uniref:AmmeMemoRadiSam system radical SAM enzyme n=1 Tax=Thermospira aquatica TaxID=2828656 RepID=A0AAX3BEV8_9SPIR|nr:AmmeMemoRadiSam system radical SAM enzyme [Thermospira aquatica]URA10759.1 AmmeMemoRadiSam system radical SAM enzyme [Thermospira aquatica]